jgi:murein DD-endopeptidase MepM/ murein hydrolase activator NlpD
VLGYSRPGKGDALDIFELAGEPVFAMHSGKITRVADKDGLLSCVYITGGGFITVYAHLHIHDGLTPGVKVTAGQCIGWVGRKLKDPHLHLEVWSNGKALSAPTPGELAVKIDMLIDH